jgi:CspA family cold shock protein
LIGFFVASILRIPYYNNLIFLTMSKGTVKFFNDAKGFGFITEDDSNKEHFVHISGLIDEIREDDAVEFDLQEGKKGLNAVNVKVI